MACSMFKIILFVFSLLPCSVWGQSAHILMPVYKSVSYLSQSLDSVFKQSDQGPYLIAGDAGSTNDSGRVLRQSKKLLETLVQYRYRASKLMNLFHEKI